MPELPEVEVLIRHLGPRLLNRKIRNVAIRRAKIVRPHAPRVFASALVGASFVGLERRGKYLIFKLQRSARNSPFCVLGHLGMTGRIYLAPRSLVLPKHAPVVLDLGREKLVFEDTRYFGRLSLDASPVARLGPEPLGPDFTASYLHEALKRSSQPIKVKLLDQGLVAGIGNIYASEALFRARISPRLACRRLNSRQVTALWSAVREVLAEAIRFGSTVPLNYPGRGLRDGLFYFGRDSEAEGSYYERLRVYDRADQPCPVCAAAIKRFVQAGRSTYYCPGCQKSKNREQRRMKLTL